MVRTSTGRVRINFHIQPQMLEALKKIASLRGTTYSDLIRTACREYVLKQGDKTLAENTTITSLTENT